MYFLGLGLVLLLAKWLEYGPIAGLSWWWVLLPFFLAAAWWSWADYSGMAPGANIGADAAIFEAVHGSAPDIAGKGIANPTAIMLAGAMMLDHCRMTDEATRLRQAIDATLNLDKVRTGDLGGTAKTAEFTQALVARLKA